MRTLVTSLRMRLPSQGTYHGDSDLHLGCINVYNKETTGGRYIPARFSWTWTWEPWTAFVRTIGTVVQAKERKDPERHLFGLWCVSGEVAMTSDIFYRGPIACGIESKIVDYTSKVTSEYLLSTDHVVSVVGTSVLWARPKAELL